MLKFCKQIDHQQQLVHNAWQASQSMELGLTLFQIYGIFENADIVDNNGVLTTFGIRSTAIHVASLDPTCKGAWDYMKYYYVPHICTSRQERHLLRSIGVRKVSN
jgi:hypothetical protein